MKLRLSILPGSKARLSWFLVSTLLLGLLFSTNSALAISADCNSNSVDDEIDIAIGTSADCNGNKIPDSCEISSSTAADCNLNDIPDECDLVRPLTATNLIGLQQIQNEVEARFFPFSCGNSFSLVYPYADKVGQRTVGRYNTATDGAKDVAVDPLVNTVYTVDCRAITGFFLPLIDAPAQSLYTVNTGTGNATQVGPITIPTSTDPAPILKGLTFSTETANPLYGIGTGEDEFTQLEPSNANVLSLGDVEFGTDMATNPMNGDTLSLSGCSCSGGRIEVIALGDDDDDDDDLPPCIAGEIQLHSEDSSNFGEVTETTLVYDTEGIRDSSNIFCSQLKAIAYADDGTFYGVTARSYISDRGRTTFHLVKIIPLISSAVAGGGAAEVSPVEFRPSEFFSRAIPDEAEMVTVGELPNPHLGLGPDLEANSKDCDNNSVPDECQSPDCDNDDIPDSCETDSDEDGTPDDCDQCPNDANKTAPGTCGCGTADTDSDSDGTPNCNDQCPNDANKTAPGTCGCGTADTDSDSDGTPNCNDQCPNDANKTAPGTCGCGTADTDSDSDGTPNCNDQCPNDANKTAPGTCGCGTADTDSDSDGTPNCNDQCPSDANKTVPGTCGCGTADVDTDGDSTFDCNDVCVNDPNKIGPGVCGCGAADVDLNNNNIIDCIEEGTQVCTGICNRNRPTFDSDGDGVTDCQEVDDNTNPCDAGSFRDRILPTACAYANGFFNSQNYATIINKQQSKDLTVTIEYRDLFGILKGSRRFTIKPMLKFDVNVNELGLEPDTYGTVCVMTDATSNGAWSGDLRVYKTRQSEKDYGRIVIPLFASDTYDYSMSHRFRNSIKGTSYVPLNTNRIGNNANGITANWLTITDANAADGANLDGIVNFYNMEGKLVKTVNVGVPNGGVTDFAAHEHLGNNEIGLAEFIPNLETSTYYIRVIRYFYDGPVVARANFHAAVPIEILPLTGEAISGTLSQELNELNIVEMISGRLSASNSTLQVFDTNGTLSSTLNFSIAGKGAVHQIFGTQVLASGARPGLTVADGPRERFRATTLIYGLNAGALKYAYAPPLVESEGANQIVDFNSFISHENRLTVSNSSNTAMNVQVQIINSDGTIFETLNFTLAPRENRIIEVDKSLPANMQTYGTIIVRGAQGLMIRNDIIRRDQYVVPLIGAELAN